MPDSHRAPVIGAPAGGAARAGSHARPAADRRRSSTAAAAVALAALVAAGSAVAQGRAADFPTRPIRIIIGFTPGGQPDIFSRLIASRLTDVLGQNVLVDNRPGAGGTIGAKLVADAVPDGHTLLAVSGAHVIQPAVARVSYDTVRDFAPIAQMFTSAYLLVVPNTLPATSVREFIALAQARPGQLNFSSAGTGSGTHFAAEMFREAAKIDVVHVPFKGIPEAITDTIAGRVQFFMAPLSSVMSMVKDGKLRPVAVSTAKRVSTHPEVPTIGETLPGFDFDSWGGMLAPAKTPRPVIDRLNAEMGRALALPDIVARMRALGAEPAHGTPEAFGRFIREQLAVIAAVAKRAGINPP
jgi:tripartite-type tricarboxylate transporter receptor subunit TctC